MELLKIQLFKKKLEKEGYKFKSQTDTEVITLLITKYLKELKSN